MAATIARRGRKRLDEASQKGGEERDRRETGGGGSRL